MARRDQRNAEQRKVELLSQLTSHRKDITAKKQVLVQQIADSKDEIKDTIKEKINVPQLITNKVKSSFSDSPKKWFIGSAIGGLIISKVAFSLFGGIFRKPKKQKMSRGLLYTVAGMAARPMIKSFLIGKARDYVAQRFLGQQTPQQQSPYHDKYNSGYHDVK